jgi:hypothetical protein
MPVVSENWTLFNLTVALHVLLYVGGPIALFILRRPIAGGGVMLASTLLPISAQTWFTHSDSPAFGLLFIIEAPLALFVLMVGIISSTSRWLKRPRGKTDSQRST